MGEGQNIYDTMRHLARHSTDFPEMCLVFFNKYPRFKMPDLHDNVMDYLREAWTTHAPARAKLRADVLVR